jgi:hypothetical protein
MISIIFDFVPQGEEATNSLTGVVTDILQILGCLFSRVYGSLDPV